MVGMEKKILKIRVELWKKLSSNIVFVRLGTEGE